MQRVTSLIACVALLLGTVQASGQTVIADFEDGTDQGFGTGFGNDASATFPIVNIGGSQRMEVLDTSAFQQAGRETGNPADPQFIGMLAASANESLATVSYDWYIDTSLSPGNYGTFLQLGTYINTGSGYYAQNFPAIKEVELNGTQLASGEVFSGTVSFTLASVGYDMPPGETFFRFGFISNGDGTQAKIYYDNISLSIVPEPSTFMLSALSVALLGLRRR